MPGLAMIIPLLDRLRKIDMRTITHNVPGQDVITKDNISLSVDGIIYLRVVEPYKASYGIDNYKFK